MIKFYGTKADDQNITAEIFSEIEQNILYELFSKNIVCSNAEEILEIIKSRLKYQYCNKKTVDNPKDILINELKKKLKEQEEYNEKIFKENTQLEKYIKKQRKYFILSLILLIVFSIAQLML